MAPLPPLPDDFSDEDLDPLVAEALRWLVLLHSGAESREDWEGYQDWKARDERHQNAANDAEQLWERLGSAFSAKGKSSKQIPMIAALAVAIASLLFAFGILGETRSYFAEYRTSIGERRSVTLADGSLIDLDSATAFDLGPDGRTISLYTGQIYVAVKHDAAHPFMVRARDGVIRTLGTQFAVRLQDQVVTTVVTENAVRVTLSNVRDRSVDVQAGEAVNYTPTMGLETPHRVDTSALTSWRHGELVFNQTPLSEVAVELERYRRGKIVVLGEGASRLSISGVFDADDPDSVLDSIARALPVTILKLPGLAVIRVDVAALR